LRLRYSLNRLLDIEFSNLYIGSDSIDLKKIVQQLGFIYTEIKHKSDSLSMFQVFYFPIHSWLDEKIRYIGLRGFKYKIRDFLGRSQASIMLLIDKLFNLNKKRPLIFIQEYHPTREIIKSLVKDRRFRILLSSFSKQPGSFRYIPIGIKKNENFNKISLDLLNDFEIRKHQKYFVNDVDISNELYYIISKRVSASIYDYIKTLDSIINYISKENLKLIVLITNLGKISTLIDCVGRTFKIPNYLIINGFMSGDFLDESKYANFINSYSKSIKLNYFNNANNVFTLGDPRMDAYSNLKPKFINRNTPTITIGTSGFNTIDLNSYSAVEFDFLFQILTSISKVQNFDDKDIQVIIKVRPNGYIEQYRNFVSKYFPDLNIEILDSMNMREVLEKSDLYISLYSQTLFEASCMGIPVIYHKNDSEICHPPFDNNSELVTTKDSNDLYNKIIDFFNNHDRFNKFLDKSIMEKYIGHLDGLNLERNINFINSLIYNQSI
jgi:hypothetical protein